MRARPYITIFYNNCLTAGWLANHDFALQVYATYSPKGSAYIAIWRRENHLGSHRGDKKMSEVISKR